MRALLRTPAVPGRLLEVWSPPNRDVHGRGRAADCRATCGLWGFGTEDRWLSAAHATSVLP